MKPNKVVQCVGWYFPSSVGGSEIYVQKLSAQLVLRGIDVTIMAPHVDAAATQIERYEHEGIRVVRYPVPDERSTEQRAGHLSHSRFELFAEALRAEQAQVFHLHSVTYGCNSHHVAAARALGMRTYLTAHIASIVCARGTLLRMGQEVCDGRILESQCVPCDAHKRGVPAPLAPWVAPLAHLLPADALRGRTPQKLRTLLETPERIAVYAEILKALFERVDGIIAVCEWLRQVLVLNGAKPEKLVLQRQGVDVVPDRPRLARAPDRPLRVAYFGRAHGDKGLDTLIDAVCALPPEVSLELSLYAIADLAEDRATLERVKAHAAQDARVRVLAPVPPSQVAAVMQEQDVIAVPSRGLETGPLVAMEAVALGIPVLGSDRGGIAEIVEHGATGWLEPAGDVERWSARLQRIARGEDPLDPAAAKIKLATSAEVADATVALYSS